MKTLVDARRTYQETALQGAAPLELVIALYDAAIEDVRRALAAAQQNKLEERAHRMSHALLVLQQLQGTLDFERGGRSARQFEQFYNLVRAKLLQAQISNSGDLLREQIRYLSEVRDCWMQAQRTLSTAANPSLPPASHAVKEQGNVRGGWRA
jgi:flagellar secretion chaperone FliS